MYLNEKLYYVIHNRKSLILIYLFNVYVYYVVF